MRIYNIMSSAIKYNDVNKKTIALKIKQYIHIKALGDAISFLPLQRTGNFASK